MREYREAKNSSRSSGVQTIDMGARVEIDRVYMSAMRRIMEAIVSAGVTSTEVGDFAQETRLYSPESN